MWAELKINSVLLTVEVVGFNRLLHHCCLSFNSGKMFAWIHVCQLRLKSDDLICIKWIPMLALLAHDVI